MACRSYVLLNECVLGVVRRLVKLVDAAVQKPEGVDFQD